MRFHKIFNTRNLKIFCRYYLSLAHVASLYPGIVFTRVAPSFSPACSIQILRSINGILAVLCSVLVYEIISHLRPNLDDKRAMIYAVILALYPLHWFFTFLYYTDVASLTAVLAMYLACLKKNYWLSALVRSFLILFHDKFLSLLHIHYSLSCGMKLIQCKQSQRNKCYMNVCT